MFVMLNFDDKAKVKSKKVKVGTLQFLPRGLPLSLASRMLLLFCLFTFAFFLSSCRRDMQDQPKVIAYRENPFYRNGVSAKPPVEGTVPRGYLRADREFYLGKKANTGQQSGPVLTQSAGSQPPGAPGSSTSAALYPDDVETFPFPITKDDLNRGQERYEIFCSVCHGATGYGDGMIARRGFNRPAPASYHQDRLRQAPVGHFFDVMTNGWGAMPSYASQIPVEDRWRIIAYVRALQLSQMPAEAAKAPTTKPGIQDVRAPGGKK